MVETNECHGMHHVTQSAHVAITSAAIIKGYSLVVASAALHCAATRL